jgi:hypothetical protein
MPISFRGVGVCSVYYWGVPCGTTLEAPCQSAWAHAWRCPWAETVIQAVASVVNTWTSASADKLHTHVFLRACWRSEVINSAK